MLKFSDANQEAGKVIKKPKFKRAELEIFTAGLSDIPELYRSELAAWPKALMADKKVLEDRIKANPSCIIAARQAGKRKIIGFITMIPANEWSDRSRMKWQQYAKKALLKPRSNVEPTEIIYILSVTVRPSRRRGAAKILIREVIKKCRSAGVRKLTYVIRIPGFLSLSKEVKISEYYLGLLSGKYKERMFSVAVSTGGKPTGIIKNFYKDKDSKNYGIRIVHEL
jgi:ribosomal protein S18 acetylase RimI-like enzyme